MAKRKARKKGKSDLEKILENLIKKTTMPCATSEIKWDLEGRVSHPHTYCFKTEYKNKIYSLNYKYLLVWPAGHKLSPWEKRGDESGPDFLLNLDGRALPELFGKLHAACFKQNKEKFEEEAETRIDDEFFRKIRQKDEQEKAARGAQELLKDFSG